MKHARSDRSVTQWPPCTSNPSAPSASRQTLLDIERLGPRYTLQVSDWTGEQFQTPAQHTAGSANPRLVLIKPLGRLVARRADVNAVGFLAAVTVIK